MASNAFDEIDQVVYDALRLNADVLACMSAERILLSDRPVDIRDEPQDATKMGARLWVLPLRSGVRLEASSTEVEVKRRYRIGFTPGNDNLVDLRKLEWNVICALVKFSEGPFDAEPLLQIESVELDESDPDRYPTIEPEEWQDFCDMTIRIFHSRGAFQGANS